MHDIAQPLKATFHGERIAVARLRGPLTLATLEVVDEATETATPMSLPGSAVSGHQFWFASDYLHHLLSMATDPSVDNTVEIDIIDRRMALSSAGPQAPPARTVRVRTAILAEHHAIEAGIGSVAEQPHWLPRGGARTGLVGLQPAVQHVMRRRDVEPCLLARSLHWIELRPVRGHARGTPLGR